MTTENTAKRTAQDIRSDVLAVYTTALSEGKAASLKVASPNDLTLSYGGKVFRHAYPFSGRQLAVVLRTLRQEGLWNDKVSHGRWEYELFHGAGETTTNRAKPSVVVTEPEPESEPEAPKTALEVLEALEAERDALVAKLADITNQITEAAKSAALELAEEIEAQEKALAAKKARRAAFQITAPAEAKPGEVKVSEALTAVKATVAEMTAKVKAA